MKRVIFAFFGVVLVIAAVAGIIISAFGIIGLWRIEQDMKSSLNDTLALLDTTLQATHDGLSIASQSLDQANTSLGSLVSGIQVTGDLVDGAVPMMDTLSRVTTVELPGTIASTQSALTSAASSAKVVDSTLTMLTALPFFGVQPYSNQVPLSKAFTQITDSLDPISVSLGSMKQSLADTKVNLGKANTALADIGKNIDAIGASLTQAQTVTKQYLDVIATLRQQLAAAQKNLPATLDRVAVFITIAFLWLGLTQIGLLMQGLEMMGLEFSRSQKKEEAVEKPAE